jgi:hypothetical protein
MVLFSSVIVHSVSRELEVEDCPAVKMELDAPADLRTETEERVVVVTGTSDRSDS